MSKLYVSDVLIVGAGPASAIAASLLRKEGISVTVFERNSFPRFSIGESLLPQSMVFLEEAGVLQAIEKANFQVKNGAVFQWGNVSTHIDFADKSAVGPGTTYEVQRALFDKILADFAAQQGADIHYNHTIDRFDESEEGVVLTGHDGQGRPFEARGQFVLDGSGFGRVLSTLLDLEVPVVTQQRKAVFTHVEDSINSSQFDREKILITLHHKNPSLWYWLIPFSNGTSSIGVVGMPEDIEAFGDTDEERLNNLIQNDAHYMNIMPKYKVLFAPRSLQGYTCRVKSLYGKRFALLGNAGEFLDPVFSSGITIALKSASLAASILVRQLKGQEVDWEKEYSEPLMMGIDTFRYFVNSWYEGTLQSIIFNQPEKENEFRSMIISILAGYAWDASNTFVKKGEMLLSIIGKEVRK